MFFHVVSGCKKRTGGTKFTPSAEGPVEVDEAPGSSVTNAIQLAMGLGRI